MQNDQIVYVNLHMNIIDFQFFSPIAECHEYERSTSKVQSSLVCRQVLAAVKENKVGRQFALTVASLCSCC